jgi:hypothetical protein
MQLNVWCDKERGSLYIIPAAPFHNLPILCTSVFLVSPLIIRRVRNSQGIEIREMGKKKTY